jgi:hypothetical protein
VDQQLEINLAAESPFTVRLRQQLHADPALRRRMGTASRKIVEKHSIGATLDAFEELYRQIQPSGRLVSLKKHRRFSRRAA